MSDYQIRMWYPATIILMQARTADHAAGPLSTPTAEGAADAAAALQAALGRARPAEGGGAGGGEGGPRRAHQLQGGACDVHSKDLLPSAQGRVIETRPACMWHWATSE